MANVLETMWPHPLVDVTMDRRVPRPGVRRGSAAQLVGIDGTLRGGLRPSSGFLKVYELDFQADAEHNETSRIVDFFPVTMRQGAEEFTYGFVYRATRKDPDQAIADVFFDYYDKVTSAWVAGNKIVEGASPTDQMHVEIFGRLGYVFIEGRVPVLFYLLGEDQGDGTILYTLTTLGSDGQPPLPGPGKRPTLISPEDAGVLGSMTTTGNPERGGAGQVVLTRVSPQNSGLYPGLTPIASSSSGASGSVSSGFSSSSPSSGFGSSLGSDIGGSGSAGGLDTFIITLQDPSDGEVNVPGDVTLKWTGNYDDFGPIPDNLVWKLGFWNTAQAGGPQYVVTVPRGTISGGLETVEFMPGSLFVEGRLEIGQTYKWVVQAELGSDEKNSAVWEFTVEGDLDARLLEPGDYAFGYYLYDSVTGRQSAYSEVAQARTEDFPGGGTLDAYAAMEIIYDTSKYDQAYIYRSVKVQDAGGTYVAGIPQLDQIINLDVYGTINNGVGEAFPPTQDFKQAIYYYQLEDKQIAYQDVFGEIILFDERMPAGGSAIMFDQSMVVSKIRGAGVEQEENRPLDVFKAQGELRWSSLRNLSPELFPPFNRYVPSVPSNEVLRFQRVGGNVVGFSNDRMYHLRREGTRIRVHEMHEGFGLVTHRGVDAVGSVLYFLTWKGLKAVDSFGKLDDVKVFDQVLTDEWKDSGLFDASVAFDPTLNTLFLLNPSKEAALAMWFNSGMSSELWDMPFTEVRQGNWPFDPTNYDDTLVTRALWVQNAPTESPGEAISGWKPKVYVYDYCREKVTSGSGIGNDGDPRVALLDPAGDLRFTVSASNNNVMLLAKDGPVPDVSGDLIGARVYVVESADSSLVGAWSTIKQVIDGGSVWTLTFLAADTGMFDTLGAGDRVCLSPVYFRWVGANVGLQTEQGMQFGGTDYHRIKQIDALQCAFIDVSTISNYPTGGETDDRFRGLVYEGSDVQAKAEAYPRALDGTPVVSVTEDEGTFLAAPGADPGGVLTGRYGVMGNALSAGVEVFMSDLDFRLLSVLVSGKILGTFRSEKPDA
jgi:hypothetical protein